jgi:hypothetical protein
MSVETDRPAVPLSQSLARDFLACPTLAYYAHVLRRRLSSVDDSRQSGTVIHEALAAYYGAIRESHTVDTAIGRASRAIERSALSRYRAAEAQALVIGYGARYRADEIEVLDIERAFSVEVGGEIWQGRIDLIARSRRNGHVYVWEHKTTEEDTSPGSRYWQRLDLDYQIPLYLIGARSLGYDPVGVVYNVLARGVCRPAMATPRDKQRRKLDGNLYANQRADDESVDSFVARVALDIGNRHERYYARQVIARTEAEYAAAQSDLISVARLIRAAEREDAWPHNGAACQRFGRACDYLPVCSRQDTIDSYPIKQKE